MTKSEIIKLSVGGVALIAALVLLLRSLGGGNGFSPATAAQDVELKCEETGQTWSVQRGFLMDALYRRGLPLDEDVGLGSPHADGRLVAFPTDRGVWRDMIRQAETELGAMRPKK